MERRSRRIVRVHRYLNARKGGIVSSMLATTEALSRDHSVTFVTRDTSQSHHEPFVRLGADVRVTAPHHLPNMPESPVDLVTIEGPWNPESPAVVAWCRRRSVPYLYAPHGALSDLVRELFPRKHPKKFLYWHMVERAVANHAEVIWYASEEERQRSQHTFPGMSAASTVIPFSSRDLSPRIRSITPTEPLRLVTAARITPTKDIDVLVRALADSKRDWHLDVAGEDEPRHARSLRSLVDDLGVTGRIAWHGFLPPSSLNALFATSHVYVAPGIESFGMSVAEALSSGLPVVASHAVALAPIINDAGATFRRGDTAGLITALAVVEDRLRAQGFDGRPRAAWVQELSAETFRRRFTEQVLDPLT